MPASMDPKDNVKMKFTVIGFVIHVYFRLFPIRDTGMNWHAQELQLHEIEVNVSLQIS